MYYLKNIIKRTIYLGYYLKKMDWKLLLSFYKYVSKNYKLNCLLLIWNSFKSVYIYNISILEYFQFNFYRIGKNERNEWAGTGFMYEVIYKLNPRKYNYILEDKLYFLSHYSQLIKHKFISKNDLLNNIDKFLNYVMNNSEKVVLKDSKGQCGKSVIVYDVKSSGKSKLIEVLKRTKNDLVEEYIEQHDELKLLSPSGLNTLRLITLINKNEEVEILGARLRITVNNIVDNLAAGNIAAEVDIKTGIIIGPGVYSDITKNDVLYHPVSKMNIVGFKIPFFNEAIELTKKAALYDNRNRTVGWDVAITNNGPDLLEGNHNWCKLLWQLPAKKGLKYMLEKYHY